MTSGLSPLHSAKHSRLPSFRLTHRGCFCTLSGIGPLKVHSNNMALSCCVALLKCCMDNTSTSCTSFYGGGHGMTWDRGLFIVILLALSLSYSLFSLTGSMPWTVTEWSQPSSAFSARSKKRRVSFYFTRYLPVFQSAPVLVQCWDLLSSLPGARLLLSSLAENSIDLIGCDLAACIVYALVTHHL